MEFADRLGWAALVMTFIGIAITILWPTKRWIGWTSLAIALVLAGAWAWPEFRPKKKEAIPDISVVISGSTPVISDVHGTKDYVLMNVDTKIMQPYAKCCYLMLIVKINDNLVEALDDARIYKSAALTITGEVRAVQINLDKDFSGRAEEAYKRLGSNNVGIHIAILPDDVQRGQIVTLRDITRLGGKQLLAQMDHAPS